MALKKSHELENGSVGDHWTIKKLSFDTEERAVSLTVNLHKDSTYKQNNRPALYIIEHTFSGEKYFAEDSQLGSKRLIDHAEDFLLTLQFFEGAVKV